MNAKRQSVLILLASLIVLAGCQMNSSARAIREAVDQTARPSTMICPDPPARYAIRIDSEAVLTNYGAADCDLCRQILEDLDGDFVIRRDDMARVLIYQGRLRRAARCAGN